MKTCIYVREDEGSQMSYSLEVIQMAGTAAQISSLCASRNQEGADPSCYPHTPNRGY